MADRISPEKRSWNMSRIKGKDTSIEVKVRKYLFHEGFRYRKNVKSLPGKPDIVLPKYNTVVFVHGCFWHRHSGCRYAYMPKARCEYWKAKFETNVKNDMNNTKLLNDAGWHVIVIWECDIKKRFEETMGNVVMELRNQLPER